MTKNTDKPTAIKTEQPYESERNEAHSWRQARLEELQEWYLSACKGRQEAQTQVALLQAHADKLAEALRDVIWKVVAFSPEWKPTQDDPALKRAHAALAAYEAAQH